MLTPSTITSARLAKLALLVRPSGYFRQKAKKTEAFVRFLQREYGGSLKRMFDTPTEILRGKLLSVHGIGPETADSILCMPEITLYLSSMRTHTEYSAAMESRTESPSMRESGRCSKQPSHGIRNSSTNSTRWLSIQEELVPKKEPRCAECPLGSLLPATSPLSKIHSAAQDTGMSQRR